MARDPRRCHPHHRNNDPGTQQGEKKGTVNEDGRARAKRRNGGTGTSSSSVSRPERKRATSLGIGGETGYNKCRITKKRRRGEGGTYEPHRSRNTED